MYILHQPVLLEEAIAHLNLKPGDNCIDGTGGSGGHSQAILEASSPGGKLLAIDADQEAVSHCRQKFIKAADRVKLVHGNFSQIKEIAAQNKFLDVQGILLDLGLSTHQLKAGQRGFAFALPGELDMRFNQEQSTSALEVINECPLKQLTQIFSEFGEIRNAHRLASQIVAARLKQPIKTTTQLRQIIESSLGVAKRNTNKQLAPVFQALRIAVNHELENLAQALPAAMEVLKPTGRLVVITYHSLEDRIVKEYFRREEQGCICPVEVFVCRCQHVARLKIITRKPIIPTAQEIKFNPRGRSAKMRVAEKI